MNEIPKSEHGRTKFPSRNTSFNTTQGDTPLKHILISLSACLFASALCAETHDVKMLSRTEKGTMIYEPEFLSVAPGDSVRFIPEQRGHNAATIDSMLPEGAEPFRGQMDEEFTVTLTETGLYGIKCSPHFSMGMVMLIEVGEPGDRTLPDDLPPRARMRFEQALEALEN